MQAVVMRKFGPPSVLEAVHVPDPSPSAGQTLIDVEYASITFVGAQVRGGRPPSPAMLPHLPAILGNGVGGVVYANGTHRGGLGRRVGNGGDLGELRRSVGNGAELGGLTRQVPNEADRGEV